MVETTRIVLASRPVGAPQPENFRTETVELPAPGEGQALLETLYLSLDPYMRGRMSDAPSYAAPVAIDATMVGATVSRVLESRDTAVRPGDIVLGYGGWQTHSVEPAAYLRTLDSRRAPVTTALGVLGMPGFTAYAGLRNIGQPSAGETVVVAAATGPVGSAVGQIAKLEGARTVGIAGGPEKVRLLTEKFGFDAAIDHRANDFAEQLAAATPDGIDVYFENVGGAVLDAVLPRLNSFARIPVCGLAAAYNATELPPGPDRLGLLMGLILRMSLTVRGFIQTEFAPTQMAEFLDHATTWVADGRLAYLEDIVDGLDQAVPAFQGLLVGKNVGKLLVRVSR
ncbi:NADP-dependent oxidoreductase [Nocardia cyriacigeorgica]|uniref:NADP-dependent oxidoreductase n=1 Tax=Nocardia cyriacigeorgica TaxID=135487 RepID=A0A6P1DAY3_9NOCA|nr:NADP-dependent oxidoreductase [Nocardia cyriacigeorgica]NEW37360.1 NADP-dependent oxidoreductase [Nocardia cyriacigeorgica]NEW46779.1 NADP-dependent oxidoreductase [Nocardia cyriacigeorgica]NEW50559.1 NADP-dependent oxidoreductase [Nocardia cyriacigeorgica]NEW57711.1 NADP-dependent oxidoreductase [Nocardia cyriacigeorgica]